MTLQELFDGMRELGVTSVKTYGNTVEVVMPFRRGGLPQTEQDEPPPTQRSGKQNLFNAEVCQRCFCVGSACKCKEFDDILQRKLKEGPAKDEPEQPAFHGPVEIKTGPDGEPMAVIDPDLLGLGKSTE